jgi:hypothetical protein
MNKIIDMQKRLFWPETEEREICILTVSKQILRLVQTPQFIVGANGERLVQRITESVCVQNPGIRAMLLDYPDLSVILDARPTRAQVFPGETSQERIGVAVMHPNPTWIRFWENQLTPIQALATALSGVNEKDPETWSVLELIIQQGNVALQHIALDFAATLTDRILGSLKLGEMAKILCRDGSPHSQTQEFPSNWPAFLAQYLIPQGIHVEAVRFIEEVGA